MPKNSGGNNAAADANQEGTEIQLNDSRLGRSTDEMLAEFKEK